MTRRRRMTVTQALEHVVASLRRGGEPLSTAFDAREALARTLAARLDDPDLDDRVVAGMAKEYRGVLAELLGEVNDDADDAETFGTALPSQVRNPPQH